jgi:hypothetical protein
MISRIKTEVIVNIPSLWTTTKKSHKTTILRKEEKIIGYVSSSYDANSSKLSTEVVV